jgi:ribosomal RNA-processing protein 36
MSENNGNKNRSKKCSFKRINKNRPQETSSKRPVSQFREVFQIKKNSVETERRDPRFDEKCGSFNEKVFKQTFSFLNDIKDKEMNDLKKLLKKTKNETKRKEIEYLLQRLQNQRTAQEEKEDKKERELEIRRTLAKESGNKLSFVNKCKPLLNITLINNCYNCLIINELFELKLRSSD